MASHVPLAKQKQGERTYPSQIGFRGWREKSTEELIATAQCHDKKEPLYKKWTNIRASHYGILKNTFFLKKKNQYYSMQCQTILRTGIAVAKLAFVSVWECGRARPNKNASLVGRRHSGKSSRQCPRLLLIFKWTRTRGASIEAEAEAEAWLPKSFPSTNLPQPHSFIRYEATTIGWRETHWGKQRTVFRRLFSQ